jgi:putative inorganic carbon (hco3(-)) transporter
VPTTTASIPDVTTRVGRPTGRSTSGYFWLLLFIVFYFYRPEDWVPGLKVIPIEKITGTLALLGFGLSLLTTKRFPRMPVELFYLILLFGQFCLTIPFAIWRGGAFQVVFGVIAKVVLIAIATAVVIDTWPQLRRLLFVQATAVPVLAAAALVRHRTGPDGRLSGVGTSFDNSNDFAFLMALTFPFCFAFLLSTRKPIAKAAWAMGMAIMGVALVLTASRVGLLTIVLAGGICLWQFGIKGRRPFLVFLAILLAIGIATVAGPGHIVRRVAATFTGEDVRAYESAQARKELLKKSLLAAIEHPFFGVGPGNFQVISGMWREAHNSFTEVAAEAGLPALILFVMFLSRGFANLRTVKQRCRGQTHKLLLAGAMQASLATFVVGAMFTTWEYQHFVYLLVAYSTAFRRIMTRPEGAASRNAIKELSAS